MCVCVCICVHVCVHMYACACVHVHTCACACVHMRVWNEHKITNENYSLLQFALRSPNILSFMTSHFSISLILTLKKISNGILLIS